MKRLAIIEQTGMTMVPGEYPTIDYEIEFIEGGETIMDLNIKIETRKDDNGGTWYGGTVEYNGVKYVPTESQHFDKFLYNCARMILRQIIKGKFPI